MMVPESKNKKQVELTTSNWKLHRFEIWAGEPLATVETLKMKDSLFIWIGNGDAPCLEELALGMFCESESTKVLTTELICNASANTNSRSKGLAARIAKGLKKNVYVSCNLYLDSFAWSLVEKGLKMEMIKSQDCNSLY